MSYADRAFVYICKKILEHGISDENFEVRPKWADGTPAHTLYTCNVVTNYDLSGGIPVMTLRKQNYKNAIDEILWIYQKKSNDVSRLHSHIWDSWADENGTIGKAYGYQIRQRYRVAKYPSKHFMNLSDDLLDMYPSLQLRKDSWAWMDQMDAVLWMLKNDPMNRAIITNVYNHADLADMNLRPCAYSMTYTVTQDSQGQLHLNGLLNQRSQDMLTANNWNVLQYSVLIHMIAQCCGMIPGTLTHIIANAHIYDRHIPIVEDLIKQYEADIVTNRQITNPKFWMNPDIKNFYKFTLDDFRLEDYTYHNFDSRFEVAV